MYATPATAADRDPTAAGGWTAGGTAGGIVEETAVCPVDSHLWYQGCSPVALPGKRVRPSSVATGTDAARAQRPMVA